MIEVEIMSGAKFYLSYVVSIAFLGAILIVSVIAAEYTHAHYICKKANSDLGLDAYIVNHFKCYAEIDGVMTKLN